MDYEIGHPPSACTVARHSNQGLCTDFELNLSASTFTNFMGVIVCHCAFPRNSRDENILCRGSLAQRLFVRFGSLADIQMSPAAPISPFIEGYRLYAPSAQIRPARGASIG